MGGLARVARMCGGIIVNGKKYVWDFARDEIVPKSEMQPGSERHALSERARRMKELKWLQSRKED